MTVKLSDFLNAFADLPSDAEVDFMLVEVGSNSEIALHPQATLGDPARTRFTLMFRRLDD